MSSSNLVASAPLEKLYPEVPVDTFPLTRITEIEKQIFDGSLHYKAFAKKHEKALMALHYTTIGLGFLCHSFCHWTLKQLQALPSAGWPLSQVLVPQVLTGLGKKHSWNLYVMCFFCIFFVFLFFSFFLCNLITSLFKVLSCLDQHYSYLQDIKYCKLYISLNKYAVVVV